jgi:methionine synthase II (cobalamin-independent)
VETPQLPLGAGWATGVGSMPGTDPREEARLVLGELPDLPHLPELPARGPGADMVGRAAGVLVDLHVDLQPSGWRLVDRPGADERRATSYLNQDLDALEEAAQGYRGPLKVQIAGPWTMLAALQLPRGEPVLSDPGARRDVVASLAEGLAGHVRDIRRRLPDIELIVQLDEPSLPTVLAGRVRSMSGLQAYPPPADVEAESVLREVIEAAGAPVVVHCCAADPPVLLLHRAGARGVSLDLTLAGPGPSALDDQLGEVLEAGTALFAGLVSSTGAGLSDPTASVEPVRRLWRRLGLPAEMLSAERSPVVVTPTCGLAGADPRRVPAVLQHCRAAAQALVDDPEG